MNINTKDLEFTTFMLNRVDDTRGALYEEGH
jgi:hypothetical protein|nr:MAG TPA: hypothetical protein [Caudoviricetes sp.]